MSSPHRSGDPRISVEVQASDPISQSGVVGQLRPCPEITVHSHDDPNPPDVTLVVADAVEEDILQTLRRLQRARATRLLLVVTEIDEQKLVSAVECGVLGFVRRSEATPERLVDAIRAVAKGDGCLPPDLLGRLLGEVGRLQGEVLGPRGLHFTGLAAREVDVLRLMAEGLDTAEVAAKLAYSERTIKYIVHGVMTRLQVKNRTQAVAYAMRQGLI
ncbi:LuxR C-terminal-related transcriptional regulator [Streptomyces sp. NPDC056638]|uniref:helix-turn-helix transcriptional regulator n=1 Tax=Streptomyces sp. NPDC056638 TaxID=3345887 RepID=UPI0036AD0A91